MNKEEELILGLILEEENQNTGERKIDEENIDKTEDDDELYYIQEKGVTLTNNVWFSPKSEDSNTGLLGLPIEAEGVLDDFLVVANSSEFRVKISIDGSDVVDDTYSDLASITNELTHVSAYERDGLFVVSVEDYPFRERLDTSIRPLDPPLDISRIRTEAVV